MNKLVFIDATTKNSFMVKILGKGLSEKFNSRGDAIRFASSLAKKDNLDFVFRRKDGVFQFRNSY